MRTLSQSKQAIRSRRYRQKHPEKARANNDKHRIYVNAHREHIQAYDRSYYAKNRETKVAQKTHSRQKNPERERMASAKYRQRHPTYMSDYITAHPEQTRAHRRHHRALIANAPINDFTHAQWIEIQMVYDHRCVYCHRRAKGHLTQDHLTPLSKRGSHTASNIVPACQSCNSKKGTGAVLAPVQPLLLTVS